MSDPPVGNEGQPTQCPKCGTQNPLGVAQCLYCGIALSPMQQQQKRAPLLPRLLVSLVVGLLALAITTRIAYREFCDSAILVPQGLTLTDIEKLREAIEAYRQANHALPETLQDLRPDDDHPFRADRNNRPVDLWRRPLNYWTDGTRYRVTAYGRDGRPGGVGLDYDLSSDDLPTYQASKDTRKRPTAPQQATPTFTQFLADRGEFANSGSGGMMALMSLLTGAAAFALAFRNIGHAAAVGRSTHSLALRLTVTVGAALLIGIFITVLHVPTGH